MQISVSIARTNDDKTGDLDEGIEDYCISMRRAAGRTAMVEVNISCPNTMAGEPFNQSPEALDKLFTELDKIERPQPTLVKMPLNKSWEEFKDLLDVLAEHNVQGLSIANLQKDRTGMEIPRDWEGGLSGSPCYEASNERIKQVYREYGDRFAIAGIGGVFTPQQAYAKIRSGSSLVMFISSLMYRGPQQITVLKRGACRTAQARRIRPCEGCRHRRLIPIISIGSEHQIIMRPATANAVQGALLLFDCCSILPWLLVAFSMRHAHTAAGRAHLRSEYRACGRREEANSDHEAPHVRFRWRRRHRISKSSWPASAW